MFILHAVQAHFGDALILEFGTDAAPRFILVRAFRIFRSVSETGADACFDPFGSTGSPDQRCSRMAAPTRFASTGHESGSLRLTVTKEPATNTPVTPPSAQMRRAREDSSASSLVRNCAVRPSISGRSTVNLRLDGFGVADARMRIASLPGGAGGGGEEGAWEWSSCMGVSCGNESGTRS